LIQDAFVFPFIKKGAGSQSGAVDHAIEPQIISGSSADQVKDPGGEYENFRLHNLIIGRSRARFRDAKERHYPKTPE